MNKPLLCILLCFCFINLSFAQKVNSVDLSFIKLDKEDAFIISPSTRFNFNNHSWSVGPALLYSFGDQIEERDGIKLTGIAIGYENYLHGREAKWNMYHSFDFVVQRIKDVQNSQFFDSGVNAFVVNRIEQIDKNLFLGTGAGVLWNLSNKLSITQSIGIGVNAIFRNTTSDFDDFDDVFLNQQWSLKTGIRYSLGE